jgi:hypothetical protein
MNEQEVREISGGRTRHRRSSSPGRATEDVLWKRPRCGRSFTRKNQRHARGTGERSEVLRNRPGSVVRLYALMEAFAKSLGSIEIVTRQRCVLLRSVRIFTDLVVMSDAVRVAVHLRRKVDDPIFFEVGRYDKMVTHVAKLKTERDFGTIKPYLKEAYDFSLARPRLRSRNG